MKIQFTGVYTDDTKTQMSGSIMSSEIVDNFEQKWIPGYQRGRLEGKKKIQELKSTFLTGQKIPPVILHTLKRPIQSRTHVNSFTIDEFDVVDGQQRLTSLYETGKRDYPVPVLLFVGDPVESVVKFYQKSNGTATKLTLGDYLMSYKGPIASLTQQILRERGQWGFPMARSSSKAGLGVATGATLVYWTFYHFRKQEAPALFPRRDDLKELFEDPSVLTSEVRMVSFAYRKLATFFTETFGEYDLNDVAWQRTFFLAWNLMMVREFMDSTGAISLKRNFLVKARDTRKALFGKARFKELSRGGVGKDVIELMYDLLAQHFNFKVQNQAYKVKTFEELQTEHDEKLHEVKMQARIDRQTNRDTLR